MDLLLEILIQFFVEFVMELLGRVVRVSFHGVGRLIAGRVATWLLGTLLGLACGFGWGQHLAGQSTWPKLFWVSVALGVVALVRGVLRSDAWPEPTARDWRHLLVAPWNWDSERLFGFALINLGVVVGIAFGFGPSWAPVA